MSKHTPGLAADGWTLIYRDAKQASYAKGAIQNGADAECVGPGDEGWYWYHEGTGQLGDRISLDLIAAAPDMLEALKKIAAGDEMRASYGTWTHADTVLTYQAIAAKAAAKAEGRS